MATSSDKARALIEVKIRGNNLQFLSEELKDDPEIVLAAAKQDSSALQYASKRLKGNQAFILSAMNAEISFVLHYAPEEFKGDRGFMLAAIQKEESALQYASEKLKGDRTFILAAVKLNGKSLYCAPIGFKDDPEIVLAATKQDYFALHYASKKLKGDRKFLLAVVKENGPALYHASEKLKDDRAFMLAAVTQYGSALGWASEKLRSDREIVLAAVKQNGDALQYTSAELKGDREIVLAAVKQNGIALNSASKKLKGDREIVLAAVKQNGIALNSASKKLKGDREIVLAAIKQHSRSLCYASKKLKGDRRFILAIVKQSGDALGDASTELKDDSEIVLTALKQSVSALHYASERLKGDREFILAAVKQNGDILQSLSVERKDDPEIVLAAVKQNGVALAHASAGLKDDPEIVLAAVKQNGTALARASVELKNDREIVLAAVKQNGTALAHASVELKNDREIVLAAVKQNGTALVHASVELKNDREIVLAAVEQNVNALQCASIELKSDREIVLPLVRQSGCVLRHASGGLKSDREIVLAAVQQNGDALQYASAELKGNREIVLAAVQQNGDVLQYASAELKGDREIVLAAVQQNGTVLQSLSVELKGDREIVLAAVRQNGNALQFLSKKLKCDKEIVLAAVNQNGCALCYASAGLKDSREIVLAAVEQNGDALQYASVELKNDREFILAAVKKSWRALQHASEKFRDDRQFILATMQQNRHIFSHAPVELKGNQEVVLPTVEQPKDAGQYASAELEGDPESIYAAAEGSEHALRHITKELKEEERLLVTTHKTEEVEERIKAIRRSDEEQKAKEEAHAAKEAQKKAEKTQLAIELRQAEKKGHTHKAELKALADAGNVEAQFSFGEMLLLGEKDHGGRMTYDYLRAAALKGHGQARLYLGILYEYGLCGTDVSLSAALFFYEKADLSVGLKQLLLGVHCLIGSKKATVPYAIAGDFFELAYMGIESALLTTIEVDKKHMQRRHTQIRAFFENIAVEPQATSAHLLLAMVHIGGLLLGAEKDLIQAERFFQKIKRSPNARLQYNIGMMYEKGLWVEQSYSQAAKWYEVAGNRELTCAQASLSNLYRLGHLGAVDLVKAEEWARRADIRIGKYMDIPFYTEEPLPNRPVSHLFFRAKRLLRAPENLALGQPTENIPKARVLYDYDSTRDDRLSVQENDIVYVWNTEGNWWLCENRARQEGRVPRNFLELLPLISNSLQGNYFEDLPAQAIKIKENDIEFALNPEQERTELGHGNFGRVSVGIWFKIRVAVKQSHVSYMDENIQKEFQKEIETMGNLRHPNIVALLAYTEDTPIPWLVMECMDRGTLYHYLGGRSADRKHIFLPLTVVCNININIASGLMYLHSIGLVHRDIKSQNILLCSKDGNDYFAKIADFGLSNFCRNENTSGGSLKILRSDTRVGTLQYMAPELFDVSHCCYSEKTDIFSAAMIQWESISHESPYNDNRFPQDNFFYFRAVEKHVKNGDRENILENAAPKAWWDLTRRCWAQKAEERPRAKEVLEELMKIREKCISNNGSSNSSGSPATEETTSQSTALSLPPTVGSARIAEFEFHILMERDNGFYAAVTTQMRTTNRVFLRGLTIREGSTLEDTLQMLIEGEGFRAEENNNKDEMIYRLAERSQSIVAIIDTQHPHLGFQCYFNNHNGERKKSYDVREVPVTGKIIRLATTGDQFFSVKSHPELGVGGLRARFNGELWGGYSLASSTTRLSSSRITFTAQMNSARGSSSAHTADSLHIRALSSKGKDADPRYHRALSLGTRG